MVFLRPSFGACATFSRFSPKLIFSPLSGKTFNDNSTKRNPLSALTRHSPRRGKQLSVQCATLPEGDSLFIRAFAYHSPRRGKLFIPAFACHSPRRGKQLSTPRATLPEGESSYRHRVSLSPKGKAFLPSVKTFYLFASIKTSGKTFYLFNSIKTNRKTFNNIK